MADARDWRRWPAPRSLAPAVIAGLCAGAFVIAAFWAAPDAWREPLRERVFDLMLEGAVQARPARSMLNLAIVDIDTTSLETIGPWPWRRETIARLIQATTASRPAAVAVDILLAGNDTRSPAAIARQLAAETSRSDLADLASTLVDGDGVLREAMASGPVVLGWVLDPRGDFETDGIPILTRNGARFHRLWSQEGATGPPPALAGDAAGAGALSLPGDTDGVVRRVPLFVSIAGAARPGLMLEALRVSAGASGYLLAGDPPDLSVGELSRRVSDDGLLRLVPGHDPVRTLRASAVLEGSADLTGLEGALVFIGGSAAELGGLRTGLDGPLTPSTLLHAQAARQFAAGIVPIRPAYATSYESAAALVLVLAGIIAAQRLRPLPSVFLMASGVGIFTLAALWLARSDRLLDPLMPLAAGLAAFLTTSVAAFSESRLRELRLRRRFEQHLAPDVVARIVANPSSIRLSGERREITALFTDIEGFTLTTREAGPEQLVAVLDGYFDGVTRIVGAHGGMVDKLVGDAVHAIFNAPLDLPNHPSRAIACAGAILAWTEAYRRTGLAAQIGLGRTRQGIETGLAIVGDVGVGAKLDYTAHGDAVNTAARLEALNKELGSSICIGPVAAARCKERRLRPFAAVALRGLGTLEIFTLDEGPISVP
ncbi:adenylate/guanylate cyclase domain-containing protein [Bosea sp. AAP35]|uniref:CHASE2 domain-containing protein n=1 Tax=Bosea sp. AAP35 TaxID=1523417 RepID=UPI0006B8D412|nr:adenylate/guanylate cyclase domain-containing protein [Bosea sp. AAP35]